MEIKRVIAGGLATLTAGATMVLGVGAVTLGDFVTVSGSTMTSPYIVIGDKAAAADTLAAADIAVALAGQATETVSVSGSQATMAVSDGALVKTKSDTLYLDEALNATMTKFTYQELPVILASGTIEVDNSDVDFTQRLYTMSQTVAFSEADNDWEEAKLNLELVDGTPLYTYEIRFSPGVDTTNLGDVEITLLGQDYVFSDVATANTARLFTMFASSQTETLAAGESTTVNVGGTDYVVTIVAVNEAGDEAVIDVNGETDDYEEGDDIEEGDLEAHVKSIRAVKFPVESGSVELFIGSQSLALLHNAEAELGGDAIDGTNTVFTNTTTDVSKIELTYTLEDDVILEVGDSFEDLVFGTFNVALGGIYPGLTDTSKDVVSVDPSSSDLEFTFTNFDDITYEQVLLVYDATAAVWQLEDGSDNDVHFLNNATIVEDEFVVVTDNNEYTYILEFKDWSGSSGEEEATFRDVSSGTEYVITINDVGSDVAIGSLDVKVTDFNTGAESVAFNNTDSAVNDVARLLTKNGASLEFNINVSCGPPQCAGGLGDINSITDAVFVDVEDDGTFDIDDELTPETFNLTVSETSDDVEVHTTYTEMADEDGSAAYYLTPSGTYILGSNWDEERTLDIYIPDEATPVYVAFGASPAFSAGEGVDAGTVEQAVQIKNSISKMESDITNADTTLSRDLVLLGGPCANGLVAELLEMSETNPACGTEFTALYPTEGVITVVEEAFGSGQKALVVAGVDRGATRDLAVMVMQGTLEHAA